MRRLFVLLMIALLPLRGWAGDFMSIQMAGLPAASGAVAAMPADCPMHGMASDQASAPDADADSDATPGSGKNCDSCELCLPFMQLPALDLQPSPFIPHAQPLAGAWHFLSAPVALGFKPPIS